MDNIYKFDLVIVIGSLLTLLVLVGYVSPLIIAPIDEFETSETEVLFLIDKADKLLIDDNIDFSTPEEYEIRDGLRINLEPGKYYWKAVGVLKSEIRTFTVKSRVSFKLKEMEDGGYGVVNSGNVRLSVDVYDDEELVEIVKLGVSEERSVSEGDKYIGGMENG
jgi:hypothetical protein